MRYLLKALLVIIISLPLGIVLVSLAPFDRRGKIAHSITRLWSWLVLKIGRNRLRVQGLEHLDAGCQYIFMANHRSNIDIPALVRTLLPFQLRWVAKRELLFVPLFGLAFWAARHIVVDRSNSFKAMMSLRKVRKGMEGGSSVVFFPEGTRSQHGKLLPFKPGGFMLATMTGTPIIPITVNGSDAVLPKGDWRIRGGEIEVVVHKAVAVDPYHRGNLRHLMNRVRGVIESRYRRRSDPASAGPNHVRGEEIPAQKWVPWNR